MDLDSMNSSTGNVLRGNVVIGQSGGPTAVINQSLAGVIETLRRDERIGKIFGCVHAVRGIVNEQFIELQDIDPERIERMAMTPSAALGSGRDKPDLAYVQRICETLEKWGVHYFFYIGGNDSSDACRIVNNTASQMGYELRCFHVPKTIDNDLACNDHTPGYGSAAKFVAHAFLGDNLDNRALGGIKIDVVMGRQAGFLTAASVLARRDAADGPHLVYLPEVDFDETHFLDQVDRVYSRYGRCLIAVSEGIHGTDGIPILRHLAEKLDLDAHGNIQLSGTGVLADFLASSIRDHLSCKLRIRADTFGYLQRSFAGCVSRVDCEEARQVGRETATMALDGAMDGSMAIERICDDPYRVRYRRVELDEVAGKTRTLDRRFIVDGYQVSDSFCDYLRPLVGELPPLETFAIDSPVQQIQLV